MSDPVADTTPLTRDILRVFTRHPVSRAQLVLCKLVRDAAAAAARGERATPGVRSPEVKDPMGLDQAGHRGMMSALTKRVNYTQRETQQRDKPGHWLMFDQSWDGVENTYVAKPELLAAIDLLPTLRAHLERSLDDVVHGGAKVIPPPAWLDMAPPQLPAVETPKATEVEAEPEAVRAAPFAQLLDALDEDGLYYPSSLVANLLLALQTKRFVLLTGISGTGKTRIAQALARRYRVRRTVSAPAELGGDALAITVREYMHKHRRFILPQALAAQLGDVVPEGGAGKLAVAWPGGRIDASVWSKSALRVLLRGELRAWFVERFPIGATFVASIEYDDQGEPRGIRLDAVQRREVIEEELDNYEVIAVRPDWTDSRGLLGYYNPITQQYVTTPFLRMLLRATDEVAEARAAGRTPSPFFAVLDEMNLARVEHYFSDFLSALESGEALDLHDVDAVASGEGQEGDQDAVPVPRKLVVPPNLFFMGTVNVDESTTMFSPKVLDRAFTLELTHVDLDGFAGRAPRSSDLDLSRWAGTLAPADCRTPTRDDWIRFAGLEGGVLAQEVGALHRLLAAEGRHFGYRVANELGRFVLLAWDQATDPEAAAWEALDLAILQKVLVKLHGTQAELSALLDQLLAFSLVGADGLDGPLARLDAWHADPLAGELSLQVAASPAVPDAQAGLAAAGGLGPPAASVDDDAVDRAPRFPRSAFKLWRMQRRLRAQGFTSWVE